MHPIDSIQRQEELERFLTPLRSECKNVFQYGRKFVWVQVLRTYYFYLDLFHCKVRWRNDHYVASQVSDSEIKNQFTDHLVQALAKRGIKVFLNIHRVNQMIKKIESCPPVKELYELAKIEMKNSPYQKELRIRLVDQQEDPDLKFDCCCSFDTGEILINQALSENKALEGCVFELHNAKQITKFCQIYNDFIARKITDAEEYALKHEKIEFENLQSCMGLLREAVNTYGWPIGVMEKYSRECFSFEEYISSQRASGHFQFYVDYFNKYYSRAWW